MRKVFPIRPATRPFISWTSLRTASIESGFALRRPASPMRSYGRSIRTPTGPLGSASGFHSRRCWATRKICTKSLQLGKKFRSSRTSYRSPARPKSLVIKRKVRYHVRGALFLLRPESGRNSKRTTRKQYGASLRIVLRLTRRNQRVILRGYQRGSNDKETCSIGVNSLPRFSRESRSRPSAMDEESCAMFAHGGIPDFLHSTHVGRGQVVRRRDLQKSCRGFTGNARQ